MALSGISVSVYSSGGVLLRTTSTNGSGVFSTSGLPAGTYYARTVVTGAQNYLDGLYDGLACTLSCTPSSGTPITVTAGATTGSVDFALAPGGAISGRVTNAITLANVQATTVAVYNASGAFLTSISTAADGTYTLSGLATGTYYVKTLSSTLLNEVYDNIPCVNCTPTSGTPISVTAGNTTSSIDFALTPGGIMTGTVTDASNGTPLAGISVWVLSASANYGAATTSNASGVFWVAGLPAGSYTAFTSVTNNQNYLNEAFDNVPCPLLNCSSVSGTPIAITAGNTTTNINFSLTPGATVSGTVTSASGSPLNGAEVRVYSPAGTSLKSTTTNGSGMYSVAGLAPGSVLVKASPATGQNYVPELHSDIPCTSCSVTIGTPVAVSSGATATINFSLSSGGTITGTVTGAGTGLPVSGLLVAVYSSTGLYAGGGSTNGSGIYTVSGLPTGSYFARTFASTAANLVDQIYSGVPCTGYCLVTTGTAIPVVADATTSSVNFALATGGSITGTVTDAGTTNPIDGSDVEVEMHLYSSTGVFQDYTYVNAAGVYTFTGIPTGSYFVRTYNFGGYIDELFDNQTGVCLLCPVTGGTAISVTAGQATSGIDFALAAGGRISGRVTDTISGAPIPYITVKVYGSDGGWVALGQTDQAGDYITYEGLPSGSYYVRTFDETGHIDEDYDNQQVCAPNCLPTSGTPVTVTLPSTTSGIDFALAQGTELIQNGSFTNGTSSWSLYATPTMSYMTWEAFGPFRFNRQPPPPGTANQAVIFQNTNTALAANTPLIARFLLSNTSVVRKRISVLVHDSNFSDLAVCTFWLPPGTEDMAYTMRTRTTKAWVNATISFYAASTNVPAGFYEITNVSLQAQPSAVVERTDCLDPFVAPATGAADSANLLVNGDFASGSVSPGWSLFGQIQGQVTNGVFEFIKLAGTPSGVLLQPTGQAIPANTLLTSTFELGNSSGVRKRVTVILHDNNFSDLSACTFWVPAGQALSQYTMRMFTTQAWSNATFSVYPATAGADQWIRLDNATLRRTPSTVASGAECLEPVPAPVRLRTKAPTGPSSLVAQTSARAASPRGADAAVMSGDAWHSDRAGRWTAVAGSAGTSMLFWKEATHVQPDADTVLSFLSRLRTTGSWAEVVVTAWDGRQLTFAVEPSDEWRPVDVDLGAFEGESVTVEFLFHASSSDASADVWDLAWF